MNSSNSFSISSQTLEGFKYSLDEKIKQEGQPSLAIIFANADLEIHGIHQLMEAYQIPHIGGSSAGEICDDQFHIGLYSGLFLYFPMHSFKIYHAQPGATELSGEELGSFAKSSFHNPGIYMLIASKDTQTDLYINGIQQSSWENIPIYGGNAFDNLQFEKYTVFAQHYLSNHGVVAIVFDGDQIDIYGDAYSGWDSIGAMHTITKSNKNELLEIDGKPALDLFIDYFDYFDLEKAAKGADDRFIIGNHPINVIDQNGATALKSPMQINLERKSMSFYCSVPVGTTFKFCTNPKIEIIDNLIDRISRIKNDIDALDGLLITSCASRYLTLGPFFKKEVKRLFNLWNKPMAGFLSAGEIGNVREGNKSYFHNVTCVFTGFKLK